MSTMRSSRTITEGGVKDLVDLALLDKDDVNVLLDNDMETFLIRRILSMVTSFLRKGCALSSTTSISIVMAWNGVSQSTLLSTTPK
eukprot:8997904-Ditylum_brightwellii.AAC.1